MKIFSSDIEYHMFMANIKCNKKLLIIGPIYDKIEKLEKIRNLSSNYELVIFNGNLCYPYDNLDQVKNRISLIEEILSDKILYNLGNYDLELLIKSNDDFITKWINSKPHIINVQLEKSNVLVISGGISPQIKQFKELNNIENCFISKINNKPWHDYYHGLYGYVISNNPLTNEEPKFYNYSMQIGNKYNNSKLYAQEIGQSKLLETILL